MLLNRIYHSRCKYIDACELAGRKDCPDVPTGCLAFRTKKTISFMKFKLKKSISEEEFKSLNLAKELNVVELTYTQVQEQKEVGRIDITEEQHWYKDHNNILHSEKFLSKFYDEVKE